MQSACPMPPRKHASGLSIAGMVIGIIACSFLFISCCVLFFISFPLAILGIVLIAVARKKDPSSPNTAGLILNLIALSICFVIAVCIGFSIIPFFPFF